jgi:hypothetical protein
MKKIELVLAFFVGVGMLARIFWLSGGIIYTLATLVLSGIYFVGGFFLLNNVSVKQIFMRLPNMMHVPTGRAVMSVATGVVFAILLIGILFQIMLWPGSGILLQGIFLLGILFFIATLNSKKWEGDFYQGFLIRASIIGVLSMMALYIPKYKQVEWMYRDYPTFVDAWKKHIENPSDSLLMIRMEEERKKIKNK